MEYSSARAWATYTGRLIFCVLANSFINILPNILNNVTTKYLPATEKNIPRFLQVFWLVLHVLSFPFSFPPLHYNVHSTWTDCRLSQFPHAFPGSILHILPVDNQHANPFRSKLGQARNCLRLRCGRITRGKQHLFPDARLCVKGSLFDGFPCTNWGFSLPTFDYLTALSKWRQEDGKREAVRPLTLCGFHQLDRSVYSHMVARHWRADKGASVQPPMAARNDEPERRTHSRSQIWGWQADPLLVFQLCHVIPIYLQNYPSIRHGEE